MCLSAGVQRQLRLLLQRPGLLSVAVKVLDIVLCVTQPFALCSEYVFIITLLGQGRLSGA